MCLLFIAILVSIVINVCLFLYYKLIQLPRIDRNTKNLEKSKQEIINKIRELNEIRKEKENNGDILLDIARNRLKLLWEGIVLNYKELDCYEFESLIYNERTHYRIEYKNSTILEAYIDTDSAKSYDDVREEIQNVLKLYNKIKQEQDSLNNIEKKHKDSPKRNTKIKRGRNKKPLPAVKWKK